jgi:hypothetical protein
MTTMLSDPPSKTEHLGFMPQAGGGDVPQQDALGAVFEMTTSRGSSTVSNLAAVRMR